MAEVAPLSAHPLMRPSSMHRREMCPGSFRQELATIDGEPDDDTVWSTRGTAIHDTIAWGIRQPSERRSLLAAHADDPDALAFIHEAWDVAQAEFRTIVDIEGEKPAVLVEHANPGHGTPDLVLMGTNYITIIDWKSGWGYCPPPHRNRQVQRYLVGALDRKLTGSDSDDAGDLVATLIIKQPGREQRSVYGDRAIMRAMEELHAIYQRCERDDAPLIVGPWCDRCRAKCPARARVAAEASQIANPVESLMSMTEEQRVDAMARLRIAQDTLQQALNEIKQALLGGSLAIEGYAIKDGRSTRKWTDEDAAWIPLARMADEAGVERDELARLISPAQAEKLLGKEYKDRIAELVTTVPGNPTVKMPAAIMGVSEQPGLIESGVQS